MLYAKFSPHYCGPVACKDRFVLSAAKQAWQDGAIYVAAVDSENNVWEWTQPETNTDECHYMYDEVL